MTGKRPVALITGASSGIGAACAHRLAAVGYDIAINFLTNGLGAEEVAKQCESIGVETLVTQGSVAKEKDCERITNEVLDRWGRIDSLVNNAGITRFADARELDALTMRDFEEIFSVNVGGAYQMTKCCEVALRLSPNASVINVSSHSGMSGIGSSTAYSASKGALNTLTVALARALAPEVRVNAVCPGFVDTSWMKKKIKVESELVEFKKLVGEISPLQRLVSANEVAEAVEWFAVRGRSTTGQLLVVDGGTHLTIASPVSPTK